MTPERQKWWGSLPTKQRYLYREIAHLKYERSAEKYHANTTRSSTVKRIALSRVNCCTAHIRALKHELDSTTAIVYAGYYQEAFPTCRCKKCGGIFYYAGQSHCCWCGRKIVEVNNK